MTTILGLDPGLATFGACALSLPERRVLGADVFRSSPSSRKHGVAASDDRYRRARDLCSWLNSVIDRWRPVVLVSEAMSFPRSAHAIISVALAWGVVAAIAEARGLPLAAPTPKEWKSHVSGRNGTVDSDLYAILYEKGGACVEAALLVRQLPRGSHVHALDALGVALWGETADVVRAVVGAGIAVDAGRTTS
jgi:Holliday junction resolvasome RuvABC endonuclease subunit